MTDRERVKSILNYEEYDRMPISHFGFWDLLEKWRDQGHVTPEQADDWTERNVVDDELAKKLGFDFGWDGTFCPVTLFPEFESKVVEEFADGRKHVLGKDGVIIVEKADATGIPSEIGHTLTDRDSWEEHYKGRLQFFQERIDEALVDTGSGMVAYGKGGREFLQKDDRTFHYGIFGGSLFGEIRNWLGMENSCFLYADDPGLFKEIIDTVAELRYQTVKSTLEDGAKFDHADFWEDICFKNGPIISPDVFAKFVGPHYKRITGLLNDYGINISLVDCDGLIDSLIPVWLENGVNTMFPVEVGTWDASIAPWREKYGKELRGVGGMRKYVFALDRDAVDVEIERLRPLVDLGGYIPCPDHRISPDAKWDNVRYYCDKMHEVFG